MDLNDTGGCQVASVRWRTLLEQVALPVIAKTMGRILAPREPPWKLRQTKMIKVLVATVAILALTMCDRASAGLSTVFCVGTAPNYAYLSNSPTLPGSTEVITITVGRVGFVLRGQSLEVQGNTINVTQDGHFIGLGVPQPTPCTVVTVGPLPAGTYEVNYYLFDSANPAPKTLAASTSMTVAPASSSGPVCEYPFSPTTRDSVAVSPPAPNSGQTITIKGLSSDIVFPVATAKVQGNAIDVTMTGGTNGFGAPTGCGAVDVGPLAPGVYTLNYFLSFIGGPSSVLRLTAQFTVMDRTTQPNYQGLWWAAGGVESGWGINLAHEGDTIVATWFTYAGSGSGTWSVMTAPKTAPNTYTGQLYTTHASISPANPFHPTAFNAAMFGVGTLTFNGDNSASFTYPIPSGPPLPPRLQTKEITRQVFGPLPTCAFGEFPNLALASNFTDLWWAAPTDSEPGWGINFAHQGDTIFATWFNYDRSGNPLWLAVTAHQTGPGVFVGTLYRTTGPPYYVDPFDPTQVVATPAGVATLRFIDGNNATFTYTALFIDEGFPIDESRTITREVFAAPGTACQ